MNELVVVPHTHWDREWYQPFQRFRMRLVTVLDRLLAQLDADPRARFTLDGQTAAIDDYLEIRPEREDLVRALTARGQLALGPWRVLADSFLCSGENLVRNLEMGLARADELGGAMRVGYLPDQFGHAAQLPQILRHVGIEVACVWRGVPEAVRTTEFWWEAPDGTALRTRYLPEGGYGSAAGVFAEADAGMVRRRAEELVRALRRWQPEGPLLGMYGTDHSAPVEGLAGLVAAAGAGVSAGAGAGAGVDGGAEAGAGAGAGAGARLGADGGALRIRLDTLGGFLGGVGARDSGQGAVGGPVVRGELRSHARANILPGVLSSRIGLKQALSRAERLVERYAEPVAALYGVRSVCRPFLDLAWRRLVDSSCHDSVTGCGVDATADQVATRIAEADDLGRGVVDLVLGAIADTVPDGGHVLFNPSPWRRAEVVMLDVPAGHVLKAARQVPSQVLETVEETFADELVASADLDRFLRKIHGRELYGRQVVGWRVDPEAAIIAFELAPVSELVFDVADVRAAASAAVERWCVKVRTPARATVAALVDVGPLALAAVTAVTAVTAVAGTTGSQRAAKSIATGRRTLSDLDNGLVHVALRSDGLLDMLAADGTHAAGLGLVVDGGDLGDEYNYAPPGRDRLVSSPDEIWNRVRWNGPLTGSLESARWFDWPTHGVAAVPGTVSGRAEATHTTEVTTRIELRHGEPFVRLGIAFDNRSDDHRVRLHLPLPRPAVHSYAEGQFAVVERPMYAEAGFGERPVPTFPAYGWVAAGGLAVLLDHVSEYELVDDGHTLALTLLRSVGLLSRNDNAWREEPAGPQLATPGAQCHGVRAVELGIYLYAGEWHESGLLEAAERYRQPFTSVPGRSQNAESVPEVPGGGVEVGGRGVVLSSCRDVGGGAPELRLVALTREPTTVTVSSGQGVQHVDLRPWEVTTVAATG